MNSDKTGRGITRCKKVLICIFAAVLMISLSIPSFAANETDTGVVQQDIQNNETSVQDKEATSENTDQKQAPEENESPAGEVTSGEDADNEGIKEEDTKDEKSSSGEVPAKVEETTDSTEQKNEAESGAQKSVSKESASAVKLTSALPANNTKVSYTSAGSHPVKFSVTTGGYTFKGTCATLGVDNAKSGKATVKRIKNTSKIAKLVYYYGYKKGWWVGNNSSKKATTVLGFTDKNCTENAKQCIEALIQRDNMGWDAFWAARKVGKYRMYSTDSFMKEINKLYKDTDVSKISIPDDVVFEMFHGATSSSKVQDFYVWRYKVVPKTENGYVAVEKVSADVSITY